MVVEELKSLRRKFNEGKIASEDELYIEISEMFDERSANRYDLVKILFSKHPGIVQRFEVTKYELGAELLLERFLSGDLRPIDVRYYFEVVKQGNHIVKKTQEVFGSHFDDFESYMKLEYKVWFLTKLAPIVNLYDVKYRFEIEYEDNYYIGFIRSVINSARPGMLENA